MRPQCLRLSEVPHLLSARLLQHQPLRDAKRDLTRRREDYAMAAFLGCEDEARKQSVETLAETVEAYRNADRL